MTHFYLVCRFSSDVSCSSSVCVCLLLYILERRQDTNIVFHLVGEDVLAELVTWQNCSSASVGLKLRIRNGLLVQTLPYDVDMKAVKCHG